MSQRIEEGRVEANGLEFAFLEQGDGPLALCLHGFPDSAHTWRHLLPELAAAGYRAVAPFMRGYAPTAVPVGGGYHPTVLATDANALHDALGGGADAVIVGHDWGASATYAAAATDPDRWSRVVGLAVPPGASFLIALTSNVAQIKRSWYMFFFQHPLADLVVPASDLAFLDQLWADWSPGFDPRDDLDRAKACLKDPANLQAALGYYRDTLSPQALAEIQGTPVPEPTQPLLYVHGADDGAVGAEVAEMTAASAAPNLRCEIVPDSGHFLHLERPDVVNRLIIEHVSAS